MALFWGNFNLYINWHKTIINNRFFWVSLFIIEFEYICLVGRECTTEFEDCSWKVCWSKRISPRESSLVGGISHKKWQNWLPQALLFAVRMVSVSFVRCDCFYIQYPVNCHSNIHIMLLFCNQEMLLQRKVEDRIKKLNVFYIYTNYWK